MTRKNIFLIAVVLVAGFIAFTQLTKAPDAKSSWPATGIPPHVEAPARPSHKTVDTRAVEDVRRTMGAPPAAPAAAKFPLEDGRLPRGPEELRENQFREKYKQVGIGLLLKQKPLLRIPQAVSGALLLLNESVILGGENFGEFRFRWSIGPKGTDGLAPWSCISLLGPDKVPIVGRLADGSLTIRQGPVPGSFLMSISETHYFLSYFDLVGSRERQNNVPPEDGSDGNGALLYFVRGPDQKIIYQGHRLRWDDEDIRNQTAGMDFCLKTFGNHD